MNFFGIGPMELVFILILALIIFGPGRLPEIGRAVGKSIRDFRAMSNEVSSQLRLDLDLNEVVSPTQQTSAQGKEAEKNSDSSPPEPKPEKGQEAEHKAESDATPPTADGGSAPAETSAASEAASPSEEASAPTPPEAGAEPGLEPSRPLNRE